MIQAGQVKRLPCRGPPRAPDCPRSPTIVGNGVLVVGASTARAGVGTAEAELVGKAAPRSNSTPVASVATSTRFGDGACNPPGSLPSASRGCQHWH